MSMNDLVCKYCTQQLKDCLDEGFSCNSCSKSIHLRCVKSAIPGDFYGDIFFNFKCQECSQTGFEVYTREKLSWLKVLVLVLYHLQNRSSGFGRKGYFHWRNHITAFVDKNWELLFLKDFKKKKKWIGTVAGTLSHFSTYFFKSGTSIVNEPAWWALRYPKLTPHVISMLYGAFSIEKQKQKILKNSIADAEIFDQLLHKIVGDDELVTSTQVVDGSNGSQISDDVEDESKKERNFSLKRKQLLPTFEPTNKKLLKVRKNVDLPLQINEDVASPGLKTEFIANAGSNFVNVQTTRETKDSIKLLDPFCHYNTAINSTSHHNRVQMKIRLMGNIRKELILSPYSGIYLKPYIRRDTETYPAWLRLMTEIQLKANQRNKEFSLSPRSSIDYTYIQPEHIPAVNSLCNNFFWSGIDMTESLQYPDFSCVVMYKKLIIGFAFIVPNVTYTENYISFIFTRPGWRGMGIGKFMLYHLIQTSLGKDITLHVSINNPALFLYQRFGFKVESVVVDFYEKYYRNEAYESKNAFFCRLER